MSKTDQGVKFSLKVVTNKQKNKVIYAEADSEFTDVLLSFLTLPLGTIVRILQQGKHAPGVGIGSLTTLYNSLSNLNSDLFCTESGKQMLLNPRYRRDATRARNTNWLCFQRQDSPLIEETREDSSVKSPKGPGNYVKGQKMYMVTDDLTVTPLCTTSSLSIINRLKVPLSDIKELELDIGLNEALSILNASLTSTSALSDGLKIKPTLRRKPKQEHP